MKSAAPPQRFEAPILEGRGGGAYVEVPFSVPDVFGPRGQLRVKGTIDGHPLQSSVAPMGGGRHLLGLHKATRLAIGKSIGQRVAIVIEPDLAERTVALPDDLAKGLHGFPDTGDVWRKQVPALTGAGFRAIVPDLRGRGRRAKPAAVTDYRLPAIVKDATSMLDALGIERAHVIGHDWGAGVAWLMAMLAPQRVDRLVAISVGAPGAGKPTLEERMEQLAGGSGGPGLPKVQARTLGIWSTGDIYLTEEAMTRSAERVTGGWRYERVEGSH